MMMRLPLTATSLFALLLATAAMSPAVAMPLSAVGVAQLREAARVDAQDEPEDPAIQALLQARVEGPRLFMLASTSTRHSVRQRHHQPTPAEIRARRQAKAQGRQMPQATAEFQGQHLVQLGSADLWRQNSESVAPISEAELAAYQSKLNAVRAKAESRCHGRKACLQAVAAQPLPEPDLPDGVSLSYRQAGVRAALIKEMAVANRPTWWAELLERAEGMTPAEQLAAVDAAINRNTRYADRPGGPWARTVSEQERLGALCRDSAVAKMLALREIDPLRWTDSNLRIVTLAPRPVTNAAGDTSLSAAHVVLVARIGSDSYVLDILKADRAGPTGGHVYALAKSPQAARGVLWAGTATSSSERWGRGQSQVARRATAVREAEGDQQ